MRNVGRSTNIPVRRSSTRLRRNCRAEFQPGLDYCPRRNGNAPRKYRDTPSRNGNAARQHCDTSRKHRHSTGWHSAPPAGKRNSAGNGYRARDDSAKSRYARNNHSWDNHSRNNESERDKSFRDNSRHDFARVYDTEQSELRCTDNSTSDRGHNIAPAMITGSRNLPISGPRKGPLFSRCHSALRCLAAFVRCEPFRVGKTR